MALSLSKLAGRGADKSSKLLLFARPSHTSEHRLVLQNDVLGVVVALFGLSVGEDQSEKGAVPADLGHLQVEHLAGSGRYIALRGPPAPAKLRRASVAFARQARHCSKSGTSATLLA